MVDVGAVVHADAAAQHVLNRYLGAYAGQASIAVVATSRIDAVASRPWLAGWHVTDCGTRYDHVPGTATDDELVIETSGTVGDPKLVRYRKSTIRACAAAIAEALQLNSQRHYLCMANPRFAYGLSVLHSHVAAEVPVHVEPAPSSLEQWASLRRRLTPNSSVYLAPHHSFLLAQDTSWRLEGPIELVFAGGVVTQSMVDHLRTSFPDATITNMYGQAELGPRVSIGSTHIDDFSEGDVGRPLPGVEVRTVGAAGQLQVASPFRMSSYVALDGSVPEINPADEWWPTGDVGRVGPDGRVHVHGRDAGDVNFLGARVALGELRAVALTVPGVLDARVSAVPHQLYGERPCVRVLVKQHDDSYELAVRKALGAAMGTSAGAVQISIVDWASLPESGKL